jgi:hypothetical protein
LTSLFTEGISTEESEHLQWFDREVVHAGFPGTAFWVSLVLPAIWTEPAILHAVVALSAAYRSRSSDSVSGEVEHFTLLQYTKSIRRLQPLLKFKDRTSINVVLVTCLLYTVLEYRRQQYQVAGVHLQSGLQLLRDQHALIAESYNGVLLIKPSSRLIDKQIFQGFAALHLQANLFGNYVPDVALLLQPTGLEMPTPSFSSLEEARDSLNKLLHGILLLSQIARTHVDAGKHIPASSSRAQSSALALLSTWLATYKSKVHNSRKASDPENPAYVLLLNYHSMVTVMCMCIGPTTELAYDAHTADFVSILERSVQLLHYYRLGQDGNLIGSIVDLGWIPPLYYTALKCRIQHFRMHAIQLLRSVSCNQGLWDASLTASIAEKVMELEEAFSHAKRDQCHDCSLGEAQYIVDNCNSTLPGSCRFFEVKVDKLGKGGCVLDCKRRNDDRTVQVLRNHFNGDHWNDHKPRMDASYIEQIEPRLEPGDT